jgi:hypothetical protein
MSQSEDSQECINSEGISGNALVTGFALDALGFDSAPSSVLPKLLSSIKPDNGTAMRDSLLYGCNLMLRLNALLQQMGTA